MTQPTEVTPSQIRDSAAQHTATKDSITRIENGITDTVAAFCAANKGELVRELEKIQEQWTEELEKVQAKLGEMNDYMEDAANKLEEENKRQAEKYGKG